jgi:LysR family glycine cleavage system transcriptional activator
LPYRGEIQVDGAGYSALCVPGRERHPPVRAFFAWLREEALLSGHAVRWSGNENTKTFASNKTI